MSGNVALRNRRRREHEGKRGGRSSKTSVQTVHVVLPLSPDDAMAKAQRAVREATGIELDEGSGAIALTTFAELVVDVDVTPRADAGAAGSDVRVALRSEGRNTALAILLLALAVLSIVGIVVVALRTRGQPKESAHVRAMAQRIEALLRS